MTEHRAYAEKRKRGGPEVKHGQSEVKPVSSPTDSGSLTFESLTHHTPSTPNQAAGIQGSESISLGAVDVSMVEKEHCQDLEMEKLNGNTVSNTSEPKDDESCLKPSSRFSIEEDGGGSERRECHVTALKLRIDRILCSRSFLALARIKYRCQACFNSDMLITLAEVQYSSLS